MLMLKVRRCHHNKFKWVLILNIISGGLARNIVPAEFKAMFDIRITPRTSIKEFTHQLEDWIREAEGDDSSSGKVTYSIFNVSFDFLKVIK